ncbi:hypothetical protein ACHQM5_002976 [Ranunculus cassubicifolius]
MAVLQVATTTASLVKGLRVWNRADSYDGICVPTRGHLWLPTYINVDDNAVLVIQRATPTCVLTNLKGLSSQKFLLYHYTGADRKNGLFLTFLVVDCYISMLVDGNPKIKLSNMDTTTVLSAACALSRSLRDSSTHMVKT